MKEDKPSLKRLNTPPKLKDASQRLKQADIIDMDIVSSSVAQQKAIEELSDSEYNKLIEDTGISFSSSKITKTSNKVKNSTVFNNLITSNEFDQVNNSSNIVSPKTAGQTHSRVDVIEEYSSNIPLSQQSAIFFETGIYGSDLIDHASKRDENGDDNLCGKKVSANGKELALFRYGKDFYAFGASCCHEGGKMYEGQIVEIEELVADQKRTRLCVECPRHHFKFDVVTGIKVDNNKNYIQPVYECVEDKVTGEIKVRFDSLNESYFEGEDF